MSSVYSDMSLFDSSLDNSSAKYNFSRFDSIRNLIREFLLDYPNTKIATRYFKPLSQGSDVAGIFCQADSSEDTEILDGLFGFIDIPAGMDGLSCDIVKRGSATYFFVYDSNLIHPKNIKTVNVYSICKAI